jgi:glycosyltransferase involved in cell wall biosynthesis
LCGDIAAAAAAQGRLTYVAYPRLAGPRPELAGGPARLVEVDFDARSPGALRAQCAFIRAHGIRTLYLSDVPTFDPRYAVWRTAGVRYVVVHLHSSGGGAPAARGWRRALKRMRARLAWGRADRLVTVSDFVAERERAVALTPPEIITRIWNAVPIADPLRVRADREVVRRELGIGPSAVVVAMVARASYEKGVAELFRAVDAVSARVGDPDVHLVFAGGGVDFDALRELVHSLPARHRIHMVGPQPSSGPYFAAADIGAAPSTCDDALNLSVLEAMAQARPVVGTRIGGIPEVIRDGVDGLLVAPADVAALARAIETLVRDPARVERMGRAARARVAAEFDPARMRAALTSIVLGAPALG